MANFRPNEPVTRDQLLTALKGIESSWSLWNGSSEMIGSGASQPGVDNVAVHQGLQGALKLLDQYGVNSMTELPAEVLATIPGRGIYRSNSPKSFGDQFVDFVTNPAFLTAAGGLYGVYAGGAAAGAGAGSGAGSAGYGAAWEGLGGLGAEAGAGSAAGAAGAASGGGSIDWGNTIAQGSTGTMSDVSSGLFDLESTYMGTAGAEEAGLASYTNIGGASQAGMVPGLGEFSETGMGGWEGNIPGGPGVTSATAQGAYQFPYADAIKGALSLYLNNQQAKDLKGIASNAASLADPFASQRPQYQQQYRALTQNPSNFFDDPAISTAIDNRQNATQRKLASQGYNMSGNFAAETAKVGMDEAFKQYVPFTRMIGESAGAFQGTQGAGSAYAGPATAANTASGRTDAGTLAILEQIFRGNQPSSAQQAQGTPTNQNVLQGIFSL